MVENEIDFHKNPTLSGVTPPRKESVVTSEIPKMIGPYKIEGLLEIGGMSILYLGIHPETNDLTTIKVLSPRFVSNPEVVKRFLTEAEIIAMTDHPNIIKLYGHGEWEGGLYIAMEYVQGVSLRQMLLQNPISLKRALEIIIDIGYALCHLHTHGVIHRDLKPENILITETGQIKVIDFGIAQLLTEKSMGDVPPRQRLIGTPIYMSPEQQQNPESVSYPSDIYSLGIISYELILGKLSHGQIHLSLMPKGIQKILNRALKPNPEDRYHDIVDFITDVSAYLHSTNLLKEKKVGDHLSELSENLRHAQGVLTAEIPKDWTGIEIGLASQKGINIYGIYYDFFKLADDKYGIIMGESSAKGAEGVIYTSMLRGMVHSLKHLASNPIDLATMINRLIIEDKIDQIFSLGCLILSPKENTLKYLSCGYGNLWQMAGSLGSPIKINANNVAIGLEDGAIFQDVSYPWEPHDYLFLNSYTPPPSDRVSETVLSDDFFIQTFQENVVHPPQQLVNTVLRNAKLKLSKFSAQCTLIFISLLRRE